MDAGGYVDARGACRQAPVILRREGMDRLSSGGTLTAGEAATFPVRKRG
ncbi:MAG TPA: hypothetical protein PLG75_10865 [Methanoculleus sp.]|nr:hypothetical protein [Methanoculleus sp.]